MRLCALCHARRKTALSSKKMVTMEKQIRTLRHICWNLSMKNKHGPATAALGSYNCVDLAVYGKKVVRASSHSTLTYPCRVPLREAASFMDVCKQIVQKGNLQTDNRSIKCNNRLEKFHSNTLLLSSRQQLLSSFVKPLVVPARHLNTTTLGSELSSNSCYRRNDRNISLSAQCRRSAANLVFQRNPVDELQQYVSVSLIPDSHQTFSPNDKEIQEARQLFVKTDCHNIQRVKTARSEDQWPDLSAPEVLLLGRSNVGKSSLLKAFFKGAPQAISKISISKQPGHTKKLHFFDVGEKFTLIDAPGYGYNMPVHYQQSVEAYLRGRRNKMEDIKRATEKFETMELQILGALHRLKVGNMEGEKDIQSIARVAKATAKSLKIKISSIDQEMKNLKSMKEEVTSLRSRIKELEAENTSLKKDLTDTQSSFSNILGKSFIQEDLNDGEHSNNDDDRDELNSEETEKLDSSDNAGQSQDIFTCSWPKIKKND